MAVGFAQSNGTGLIFPPIRSRINDLEQSLSFGASFLEADVALIWPYSSSTERLSFLLTEDAPLARGIKLQVKVTFHGSCAKEVALIRVAIGENIKLSLNYVDVTDSDDHLSTPGKKSRVELHFHRSVFLQVNSDKGNSRYVNFLAPTRSPEATHYKSTNGELEVKKLKPVSNTSISFGSSINLSSSPFSEFLIDTFGRGSDQPDKHRRKRTKFARHSGAWRLAEETEDDISDPLVERVSQKDDEVESAITKTPEIQVTDPQSLQQGTLLPSATPLDPSCTNEHLPSTSSLPLTRAANIFTPDVKPAHVAEFAVDLADNGSEHLHESHSSSLRVASTPRLEAVSSSTLPLFSPLTSRSQPPAIFAQPLSELEASAETTDLVTFEIFPTDEIAPLTDRLKVNVPVADELQKPPGAISPTFVDLDLLEYQVDTAQAAGKSLAVEDEDDDMYSPHLQIRPYAERRHLSTASIPEAPDRIGEDDSYIIEVIHDSHSTSNPFLSVDGTGKFDKQFTEATPSLVEQLENREEHVAGAHDAGRVLDAQFVPEVQPTSLEISVTDNVDVQEELGEVVSSLTREVNTTVVNASDMTAIAERSDQLSYEREDSNGNLHDTKVPDDSRVNTFLQPMTPPATQPVRELSRSPSSESRTPTEMPPTPSHTQKQSLHRFGLDSVTDLETEDVQLTISEQPNLFTPSLRKVVGSSSQPLSDVQAFDGLSSDYFTPAEVFENWNKSAPVSGETDLMPDQEFAVAKDVLNSSGYQLGEGAAIDHVVGSTSTPISYYPSLGSLLEHYGQMVDVIAVCTVNSTAPERTKSGPKHYHTTLHLVDASSSKDTNSTVTLQLFRPRRDALPICRRGDVVLLRNVKVQIRSHKPLLVSSDESAWAVFSFPGDDLSELKTAVAGPPLEFGVSEKMKARSLERWWLEDGCMKFQDLSALEPKETTGSIDTPPQTTRKQSNFQIDSRRSPRRLRSTPGTTKEVENGERYNLRHAPVDRSSMPPPPTTPTWNSAVSPTSIGHGRTDSIPPTSPSDRARVLSPQSPRSDLWNADSGSVITTASVTTTTSSKRRSMRRSTSLVHELRDGTQYIDNPEAELLSVVGSDEGTELSEIPEEQTNDLEAQSGSQRMTRKSVKKKVAKSGEDTQSPTLTDTHPRRRQRKSRGGQDEAVAQPKPTPVNTRMGSIESDGHSRITRSRSKANSTSA